MMNWTPLDLPFLVEKSHIKYGDLIAFWEAQTTVDAAGFTQRMGRAAAALAQAQLSWIDSDLCDMLESVCQDVPDWSPAACIPGPVGLAGFERPFFMVPYESAADNSLLEVPVRAMSWMQFGVVAGWEPADFDEERYRGRVNAMGIRSARLGVYGEVEHVEMVAIGDFWGEEAEERWGDHLARWAAAWLEDAADSHQPDEDDE